MSVNSPENVNEALVQLIKMKFDFEQGYEQVMVSQIVDVCLEATARLFAIRFAGGSIRQNGRVLVKPWSISSRR